MCFLFVISVGRVTTVRISWATVRLCRSALGSVNVVTVWVSLVIAAVKPGVE